MNERKMRDAVKKMREQRDEAVKLAEDLKTRIETQERSLIHALEERGYLSPEKNAERKSAHEKEVWAHDYTKDMLKDATKQIEALHASIEKTQFDSAALIVEFADLKRSTKAIELKSLRKRLSEKTTIIDDLKDKVRMRENLINHLARVVPGVGEKLNEMFAEMVKASEPEVPPTEAPAEAPAEVTT